LNLNHFKELNRGIIAAVFLFTFVAITNHMNRYFIKLAYNGSGFHGWQIQENAHSVQAELTNKLSLLLKEKLSIVGCGRTDTGVHAREFFAHFNTEQTLENIKDLVFKLNAFLSEGIVIYDIYLVDNDLHTRFSAKERTYKYYVSPLKNPFLKHLSHAFYPDLNIIAMNKAASYLLDYVDFTSFSKTHTQTATNNCNISFAEWKMENDLLVFTISADRFLRNMVRAIVGTLIEIGIEKLKPEDIKTIIELKDRKKAGFSAPAKGLFLHKVLY
jgi:tRNA pseudouridine38-40 synthase